MSLRQVEKLYKKMLSISAAGHDDCEIDTGVRSEIFQKIMEDLERLFKKIKRCTPATEEYEALDVEIRSLLLKEIQVIIDDYMIAKQKGSLDAWKKMYGDIDYYIANFYRYRSDMHSGSHAQATSRYGFYDQNRVL